MRIFSVESPLYRFISRFWQLVVLNFMWVVFSLPIITIGAATVAAYTVTLKMVDEQEGYVVPQFLKGFKENWKQGIPMGLVAVILSYLVYLNLEFFNKLDSSPIFFLLAAIIIGFTGLIHLTYAFPICARYHNTIFKTFQNSKDIAIRYFIKTIFLWIILAVLLVLFLFNSTLLFFGIIIGPVSLFMTVSGFAMRFFREIEKGTEQ